MKFEKQYFVDHNATSYLHRAGGEITRIFGDEFIADEPATAINLIAAHMQAQAAIYQANAMSLLAERLDDLTTQLELNELEL